MPSSNCCFLTCIQIPQETGKVVCYSKLIKNFPQFVVIHEVKAFSVVNEAKIDVFMGFFFFDPTDVGNLTPGSSVFSESSLYIWKFSVDVLLKPNLKDFEYQLSSMWNVCICSIEYSLALPFFGIGVTTHLSHSCGHCRVFQIHWPIQYSTFTESSFRIWNSSAGVPSPSLGFVCSDTS